MRLETLAAWCVAGGLLLAAGGCDSGAKQGAKPIQKGAQVADTTAHHDHEHGPHNGRLVELGKEEYHAELLFDAKEKKVIVYILGSDPQKSHPIDQKEISLNLKIDEKPVQFKATAAPQQDDPKGQSSRFEIAGDEQIAGDVESVDDLEGRITVTIGGKQYSGDIAHDHEHEKAGEEKDRDAEKADKGGK